MKGEGWLEPGDAGTVDDREGPGVGLDENPTLPPPPVRVLTAKAPFKSSLMRLKVRRAGLLNAVVYWHDVDGVDGFAHNARIVHLERTVRVDEAGTEASKVSIIGGVGAGGARTFKLRGNVVRRWRWNEDGGDRWSERSFIYHYLSLPLPLPLPSLAHSSETKCVCRRARPGRSHPGR